MKTRFIAAVALLLFSCGKNSDQPDATGTFEADETIVSSEIAGKITALNLEEGDTLQAAQIVGTIDATNIQLQKEQVQASITALGEKTVDVEPGVQLLEKQLQVQQSQLDNLYHERTRTENLVKADAATKKQLDDINAQIDVVTKQMASTRQQIKVQQNNAATQNKSILSERAPLEKRAAQLQDQLQRANIQNPTAGTVIAKYAETGEVTAAGKALYKIADLATMTLRAYITGEQLTAVKLGQAVQVQVTAGNKEAKTYNGTITWISDKAEFTPKTIQTKEERANLVYAVKIKVKNDGFLKLGMYADVQFNATKK